GLWKVYGDEEKSRSLFAKYQKCTAEVHIAALYRCLLSRSDSRLG
ncbi:MAG: DUF3793 family protein, partial [Anaerovoracaceae bacterium]